MSSHKPYGNQGGFSASHQRPMNRNPPDVGSVAPGTNNGTTPAQVVPASPQVDEEDPQQVRARNLVRLACSGTLTAVHVEHGPSKQHEQLSELLPVVGRLVHSKRAGESLTAILKFHLLGAEDQAERSATFHLAMELLTQTLAASVSAAEHWDLMACVALTADALLSIGMHQCCVDTRVLHLFEAVLQACKVMISAENHIAPLAQYLSQHIETFSKSELGCRAVLLLLPEARLGVKVRRRIIDKFCILAAHPVGVKLPLAFLEYTGCVSKALSATLLLGKKRVMMDSSALGGEAPEQLNRDGSPAVMPFVGLASETEHGVAVAMKVIELSNAALRLTLTDIAANNRAKLQNGPGRRLLEWAEGKPTLSSALAVRDSSSGLDFVVNNEAVIPTVAFNKWRSEHPESLFRTIPSLCLEHESGNCNQGDTCPGIHLQPGTFDELRPKGKRTCCWEHDGMLNFPELQRFLQTKYYVSLDDGTVVSELPATELSISAGLVLATTSATRTSHLYVCDLCKIHRHGRCAKPEQCKYIHTCKSAYDRISAAALARQQSNESSGTPTDGGDHNGSLSFPATPVPGMPMSPVGESNTGSAGTYERGQEQLTPNVVRSYRAASRRPNKTPSNCGSYDNGGNTSWEEEGGSSRPFRVVREMLPSSQGNFQFEAGGNGYGRTSAYGDPSVLGDNDDASSMRSGTLGLGSRPYQPSEISTTMSSLVVAAEERHYQQQTREQGHHSRQPGRRTPGGTTTPDSQVWTAMSGAQFGGPPPSFPRNERGSSGKQRGDDASSVSSWSAPSQRVNKMMTHANHPIASQVYGNEHYAGGGSRRVEHAGESRRGPGGFATHTSGNSPVGDPNNHTGNSEGRGSGNSGNSHQHGSQQAQPQQQQQQQQQQQPQTIVMMAPPKPSNMRQPVTGHVPIQHQQQSQGGMDFMPPPPPPPPQQQQQGHGGRPGGKGGNSKTLNGIPECKYYKLGCCSKGNKCTFLHAGAPTGGKNHGF